MGLRKKKDAVVESIKPPAEAPKEEEALRIPSTTNSVKLQRSLVARWELEHMQIPLDALALQLGYESNDKISRDATLAAKLSAKSCFFCGAERGKKALKTVDWKTLELCGCLADLRRDEVWNMPMSGAQSLLDVLHGVNNRSMLDNVPVVTRTCPAHTVDGDGNRVRCEKRWTLRTGSLAHAVRSFLLLQADRDMAEGKVREPLERLQDFQWPRKCRACKTASRRDLGRDANSVIDNSAPSWQGD